MNHLIQECMGFRAETLLVPAFELRVGQAICLHIPVLPHQDLTEQQVIPVLAGQVPNSGIRIHGPIRYVQWPTQSRWGLLGFFREVRAVDWLGREAQIHQQEAEDILARLGLSVDSKLGRLAGTPRTLLAIEAAWANGAQGLMFTTSGLDPVGTERVFSHVGRNLDRCAALYLSTPFTCNGQLDRHHFPGATCLDISSVLVPSHLERTG